MGHKGDCYSWREGTCLEPAGNCSFSPSTTSLATGGQKWEMELTQMCHHDTDVICYRTDATQNRHTEMAEVMLSEGCVGYQTDMIQVKKV